MFRLNRRGIIGVLLTMALGLALGAATLVVGTEVANGPDKKTGNNIVPAPSSSSTYAEADAAFREYQSARKAYDEAVENKYPDIDQISLQLQKSKARLERAILLNTPGVGAIPTGDQSASNDTTDNVKSSNPFRETPVTLQNTVLSMQSQGQSSNEQTVVAPTSSSVVSNSTTLATSEGTVGLEYYKVKSGDSLWAICQKYYGDGGMWTHILQYQIPNIAACPNLIYPGQLIALPRKITDGNTSTSSSSNGQSSSSVSSAAPTASEGDESWQETFQKDYLISDHDLTDTDTMTVQQIQAFLDKKDSCLAKPYHGSTPAQMIYDAAKKHGINPQVLLARLQCEQGLISKKSATEKELDWALGVGCYDSGNWNQKFKGFDKQIEGAAATYKKHYLNAKAEFDGGKSVTTQVDGQNVVIKNAATYSFYKYCPHFNGNKLFFDVWRGFRKLF